MQACPQTKKQTNISALTCACGPFTCTTTTVQAHKYSFSQTAELIMYVKLCFPTHSIDFMCCPLALKGLTIKT